MVTSPVNLPGGGAKPLGGVIIRGTISPYIQTPAPLVLCQLKRVALMYWSDTAAT